MVRLPWQSESEDQNQTETHPDAVVVCEFQDGTVAVYEDEVLIKRVSRSKFTDKTIPVKDIAGVDYASGITIGYIQIEQTRTQVDTGGFLSDPVNENTLHFGRGDRECAREVRDAILERAPA